MDGGGPRRRPQPLTRRQLLKAAGGAAGVIALGGGAYGASRAFGGLRTLHSYAPRATGVAREFVSLPDLRPPTAELTAPEPSRFRDPVVAPGYLMLGPSAKGPVQAGPLLLDNHGEPVWSRPISRALWATDTRLQHYRGQPVLTWWQGAMTVIGFGHGEATLVDRSYREVASVRAGNGRAMDIHEFMVTPQGTALFTCFPERVPADLSSIGGPSDGTVLEGVIQEVDIATGRVLLEWRSLDHIPVSDSFFPPETGYGFDYVHLNSIDIASDGNLLVSGRHTWALYKIDRRTGQIIWRLGGKSSDFDSDDDARFSWQHDARQLGDGTVTVFDDGAARFADTAGFRENERQSRGVVLDVDEGGRKVGLLRSYRHPDPLLANSMGNFQTLPDGHALLGWGNKAVASEFEADGTLLADLDFGEGHGSYRSYRYPWTGTPASLPAVAARRNHDGRGATLYASWNGATEVTDWVVSTAERAGRLRPAGIARRQGFETAILLPGSPGYANVTALDATGRHLGSSRAVRV